jgi:quercetin 2,3-dioxygenase
MSLSSSSSTNSNESMTTPNPNTAPKERGIKSIQKYTRLPIWPAWNGAFLFLLSKLLPTPIVAKLEDEFGGRVSPSFYNPMETSPFIMLVHHSHSFTSFDPLRYFQKSFISPEGFPSHPHRGFITLTYCLKGGMLHRDSVGVKQTYGAEDRHGGKIAQWLVAGAGMLHEEMWDINHEQDGICSKQELFQLWINLPSFAKMTPPRISILHQGDEDSNENNSNGISNDDVCTIPSIKTPGTETLVLVGEYNGMKSNVETFSPMSILHVKVNSSQQWSMDLSDTNYKTGILYMRRGSCRAGTNDIEIPTHYTATLSSSGNTFSIDAGEDGADFMLLLGTPLYEPVEARGSMVMNTMEEIEQAYNDYNRGYMGFPWPWNYNDDEWKLHVSKNGSKYR